MKAATTTWLGGVIAVAFMSFLLPHAEVDVATDALAADSDTMSIGMGCSEAVLSVLIPSATNYTITVPAGHAGSLAWSEFTGTYAWTTPVTNRGEAMDSPGSLTNNDYQSSALIFSHYAPYMVLSGEACTTYTKGRLSAMRADANDDPDLDVGAVPTGSTTWAMVGVNSAQIDTAAAPVKIIGGNGIQPADLADGGDADMTQNGEIAFGGTNSGMGGYLFMIKVNLFGNTVDGSQEDVVFTVTPAS